MDRKVVRRIADGLHRRCRTGYLHVLPLSPDSDPLKGFRLDRYPARREAVVAVKAHLDLNGGRNDARQSQLLPH